MHTSADAQDGDIMPDTVIAVPADQRASGFAPADNEPVATRSVDAQRLTDIRNDDAYWYANREIPKEKPKPQERPAETPAWVTTVIWTLIIALAVGLIFWFLKSSDIKLFRSKSRKVTSEDSLPEEDINKINFERALRTALAAGDFRLAVRLHYLQVLKLLADRNLIAYAPDKTNSQYLFQLMDAPFYKAFFGVTRSFDYIWYGKFGIGQEQYRAVEQQFADLKTAIER